MSVIFIETHVSILKYLRRVDTYEIRISIYMKENSMKSQTIKIIVPVKIKAYIGNFSMAYFSIVEPFWTVIHENTGIMPSVKKYCIMI